MSSYLSKIVLGTSLAGTIGIVSYVHLKQQQDRDKMHEGVVRDMERQQKRKIENIYVLEKQNELAKQMRKELGNS